MESKDNEKKAIVEIQNNGNRKIITASIIIVILIASSVVFVLFQNNKGRVDLLFSDNSVLSYELSARDSVINEMMTEFQLIESTLDIIKRKRNILTADSQESSFNQSRKDGIIHDIQVLNSLIDESKSNIDNLSKRLKASGIKIKQFEEKIAILERVIDEKIADIEILKDDLIKKNFELAELDKRIDTLQIQLEDKIAFIKIQDDELSSRKADLNKAYFAQGSYKDLKKRGLVKKEGGFLFLGRNKSIQQDFSIDDFQKVDITETNQIPIKARKMDLISEHPGGSYQLIEKEGKIAYLEIKDPREFWKISKFLVVETKN